MAQGCIGVHWNDTRIHWDCDGVHWDGTRMHWGGTGVHWECAEWNALE